MATVINGWRILFHPVFAERFGALREEAERLKGSLPEDQYRQHPTAKLLAGVARLIQQQVPANPNAPDFQLTGDLAKFRRAKGRGLPPRYRLFWVFSSEHKVIIFLYLHAEGVLRREGDKHDVYAVFERLVRRGEISPDFAAAYQRFQTARHHTLTGATDVPAGLRREAGEASDPATDLP